MDKKLLINNRLVVSRFYDLLFICMPLWVPISYFCLTSYFPTHNLLIFFLYLFILGETHFGATWLFFLYPNNRAWVWENKYFSIFIPLFFQTTHFYLEGFIWRFSNYHIKNNMGKLMYTTDN
jgi:hypothetical protein